MKSSNSTAAILRLNLKAWWTPKRIVIGCIIAAIVLGIFGNIIVKSIPMYKYRLTPNICERIFGGSPEELLEEGSEYDRGMYLLMKRREYVDDAGCLVVKISRYEWEEVRDHAESYFRLCMFYGPARKGDYTQVALELQEMSNKDSFSYMWDAEVICLLMQILNGDRAEDGDVRCNVWHKEPGNVIFTVYSDEVEKYFTGESENVTPELVPLEDFSVSQDFCLEVLGTDGMQLDKYRSVTSLKTQSDGSISFKLSLLNWRRWHDKAAEAVATAVSKGARVSDDHTVITVGRKNYDEESVLDAFRACCLLQLLDEKTDGNITVSLYYDDPKGEGIVLLDKWDFSE